MNMANRTQGGFRPEPFKHSIHPYPITGDNRRNLSLQIRSLRRQLSDSNKNLKQANDAKEKLEKKLSQNKFDHNGLLDSINVIMATLSNKIAEFASTHDSADQSQILLTLGYMKQDIICLGLHELANFLDLLNIQSPMAFIAMRPLIPRLGNSQAHP